MDADLNAGGMSCLCDFVFITFKLSQQFIILNDREHHSSNAMSFWNCERCCAGAWAARGFDMPCPRLGNARPSSCRGNLISWNAWEAIVFFRFGACRKLHLKQRDCVQHRNDTANALQFLFNPWIWKQTFCDFCCAISASRIHWLDLLKRHLITASIWRQPCGLCTVDWTCEEFNSLNYQLACRQKQGEKGEACAACSASTWEPSAKGLLALHCSSLFARGTFRALEI